MLVFQALSKVSDVSFLTILSPANQHSLRALVGSWVPTHCCYTCQLKLLLMTKTGSCLTHLSDPLLLASIAHSHCPSSGLAQQAQSFLGLPSRVPPTCRAGFSQPFDPSINV